MIHRSGLAHRHISRVGGRRQTLDKLGNAVANGLAGFYGRALPVRWEDGLEVEKERTKAYSGMGHRDRYALCIQVYAPVIAGGYGITHYYA
eukprot:4496393-Prymnesium_polylepis.1